jgi:hypothetical protein
MATAGLSGAVVTLSTLVLPLRLAGILSICVSPDEENPESEKATERGAAIVLLISIHPYYSKQA